MAGYVFDQPFHATFSEADLIAAAAPAVQAGQWNELGRYTVPAGMAVAAGYGGMEGQDAASGRIFGDMRDNAAAPGAVIEGTLRLVVEDPRKMPEVVLWEGRTNKIRTANINDPSKQVPLAIIPDMVTEDYSIVLYYKPDAAQTVGKTNTKLLLDVTSYRARRA